jgi:hypothetical protein
MRFHTVALISAKFGIMTEELPWVALDAGRRAWIEFKPTYFPITFFVRKALASG